MKISFRQAWLVPAIVLCLVLPARAADLLAPLPEPPAFDWSSVYAGVQTGHGTGRAVHVVDGLGMPASNRLSGGIVGLYGGYNRQFSNDLVLGVDADIGWSGQNGGPDRFILCPCGQPVDITSELDWSAALRGRIGYAAGRWLPYVAGGVTVAGTRGIYDFTGIGVTVYSHTKVGWTAGTGLEYAFRDNMVFRAEYRHSDFGRVEEAEIPPPSFGAKTTRFTSREFRLGVAFTF